MDRCVQCNGKMSFVKIQSKDEEKRCRCKRCGIEVVTFKEKRNAVVDNGNKE